MIRAGAMGYVTKDVLGYDLVDKIRSVNDGVPVVTLALLFVIIGFAFKVSAVPFHMWTPDVYEGSPTPVTAFFATAPKMAAMAMFARAMHDGTTAEMLMKELGLR